MILMKKNLILIVINILLLGFVLQATNNNDELSQQEFEIGKTYVDKDNKDNKIVLYGDYSVDVIKCTKECTTYSGFFSIEDNLLKIMTQEETAFFNIQDRNTFKNDSHVFILE